MRRHGSASVILVVLASIALLATLMLAYARTAIGEPHQFADRATSALREPAVRDLVAAKVTDDVVLKANADLVAVRPIIEGATSAVIGTAPFESAFRRAALDVHRGVFTKELTSVTLTLQNVGALIAATVARLDAPLAAKIPTNLDASVLQITNSLSALDIAQVAATVRTVMLIALVLAVASAAAALALAPDRRRALAQLAGATAVVGAVLFAAFAIVRTLVVDHYAGTDARAAARAVYSAFFGDLRSWGIVAAVAGAFGLAAATSVVRPVDVDRLLRHVWRWLTTVPAAPGMRAVRGLLLAFAGGLILLDRSAMLTLALTAVGLYLLYSGAEELLRLSVRPKALARARRPTPGPREDEDEDDDGVPNAIWAGGVAAAAVVAALVILVGSGGTQAGTAIAAAPSCNGSPKLCDRTVDQVAFPATHNSMSAVTNPGWLFAEQEATIPEQLKAGVRGLLIDAYFGYRKGKRVSTDLDRTDLRQGVIDELGIPAYDAVVRLRGQLGYPSGGSRGIYLCHGACELGALDAVDTFRQIAAFLRQTPSAVVTMVIQDEGPLATDMAKVFRASGMDRYVYTGRFGPPWPTLGALVRSGRRVLVMAEKHAQGVPWYHHAYDYVQETPYHFTRPSQFSCAPNRGLSDASLFLLNHWIDSSPAPKPSNAAKVNAYGPLLARARACEKQRGLLPNLVAVDFFQTGDLFRVVDTLNGVAP